MLFSMADPTRRAVISIISDDERCPHDGYQITKVKQGRKDIIYPETIAIVEGEELVITNTETVGIFQIYAQGLAKGSVSQEFLIATVEISNTIEFINFAPMWSEEPEDLVFVLGQTYQDIVFPQFMDLDNNEYTIEIIDQESIPLFLTFVVDSELLQISLLKGKVPTDAEVGKFEVEI